MNTFSKLIVAGSLLCFAPLSQACEARHGGKHEGPCIHELDTNRDGAVSKKEFDVFHAARFKELDANKDGKLSEDELQPKRRPMRGLDQDPFDRRFDEVDINHDGGLSKDEAEIGMPMLFGRFDEIDADKDGKITKQEVVESMKKMHEKMPAHQGKDKPVPEKK